ncbi:MAG TPA: hypothetical protein VNN22_06565 [Verrucomicrobiae bacterium]|nr:hypothetical protein [Verrucomicrobiae bacterium]
MNFQPSKHNPQPSVRLHIERLVVDESLLAGGRSVGLQAAIETELAQLLAGRGLIPHSDTHIPSLPARNIQVAPQTGPAQFGKQIAQAVHGTISVANQPASTRQRNGGTH